MNSHPEQQQVSKQGQRAPLVAVLAATIAGAAADRVQPAPMELLALAWGTLAFGWFLLRAFHRDGCAAVAALALVAVAGSCWHHSWWHWSAEDDIARFAGRHPRPVAVRGTAITAPVPLPPNSHDQLGQRRHELLVNVTELRCGNQWRRASGRVGVVVVGEPPTELWPGDSIEVVGDISQIAAPGNPGAFDFRQAMRRRRQACRVFAQYAQNVRRRRRGGPSLTRTLSMFRTAARRRLARHMSPESATLAGAVLLGIRGPLDRDLRRQFLVSGIAHVLAISGMHVGILASVIWVLAGVAASRRRTLQIVAIATIVGFAALTGARPPVLRATALVLAIAIGKLAGRRATPVNSLAAAGLVVFIADPVAFFTVGTQLSFLAALCLLRLGLAADVPPLPLDRLRAATRPRWFRGLVLAAQCLKQMAQVTLSIWFVTLPLVAAHFHCVSVVGLALNVVVWAPLAIALYSGCGAILLADVPLLGPLCGQCCAVSLHGLGAAAEFTANCPGTHVWVAGPPTWWLAAHYCLFAASLTRVAARYRRYWLTAMALWIAIGVGASTACARVWLRPSHTRLTFVAVGHGISVLIEEPTGYTALYDAGSLSSSERAVESISSVLWHYRIGQLDDLFLSHADADHYNAVPGLLQRFKVNRIVTTPQMRNHSDLDVRAMWRDVAARRIAVRTVARGATLRSGKSSRNLIQVLHPPVDSDTGSDNAQSLTLLLNGPDGRVLLTGDLEGEGLVHLLDQPPCAADVLLAPHHGSSASLPDQLLAWSGPRWTVISAGRRDLLKLPSAYRDRRAVLHTARDGCVRITCEPRRLRAECWDGGGWRVR